MGILDKFKEIFGNSIIQTQVGGNNCTQIQTTGDNTASIQFNDEGNSVIIANGQVITSDSVIYTGNGKNHKKIAVDKSAKSFSKIHASGPFDIVYESSSEYGVNVDASNEMLEKITVYVKNDILYIEPYESFTNKGGKITITVKAPVIRNILLSSAAEFNAKTSIISTDDIEIQLTGACDVNLKQVICKNINIKLSGAGDIYASMIEAENKISLIVTGAGDIDINKVKGDILETKLIGAGDITISHANVNKVIKSNMGAGSISIN